MRVLGIDLGDRRVGVAVWDDPELPARPLTTVRVTAQTLVARVADVAREQQATELVVGLPLRLDGREGLASRKARRLALAIAKATGLPVALQDERLTTTEAHVHRVMAGVTSREGREGIDARAAAIVLQTFVDARRHAAGRATPEGPWRRDDDDEPPHR